MKFVSCRDVADAVVSAMTSFFGAVGDIGFVGIDVLLDGFIGAVLGGAVTAWAVIRTLRHERSAELRGRRVQAAADAFTACAALKKRLSKSDPNSDDTWDMHADVVTKLTVWQMFVAESRLWFLVAVITEAMDRVSATALRVGPPGSPMEENLMGQYAFTVDAVERIIVRASSGDPMFRSSRRRRPWRHAAPTRTPQQVVDAVYKQTTDEWKRQEAFRAQHTPPGQVSPP